MLPELFNKTAIPSRSHTDLKERPYQRSIEKKTAQHTRQTVTRGKGCSAETEEKQRCREQHWAYQKSIVLVGHRIGLRLDKRYRLLLRYEKEPIAIFSIFVRQRKLSDLSFASLQQMFTANRAAAVV